MAHEHFITDVMMNSVCDEAGVKPGDTLLLLGDEKRGIAIPPKGAFAELFGVAFQGQDADVK